MITLPILTSLDVTGYGLYPGSDASGLHLRFRPGLTLIIGANGLGKTTLVTLLYRMITGPYDIPALATRLTLGNADLEPRSLSATTRDQFRARVSDGARNAVATLVFRLGREKIVVSRSMRDLSLHDATIGSDVIDDEESYQSNIVSRMGVGAFSDVILILRHVMFLFEDRRTLVWDPGAQKQLLRLLFLSPTLSQQWTKNERDILELDTQARNLRAVISTQQKQLAAEESASEGASDIRAELKTLEALRDHDVESRNDLLDRRDRADEVRKLARQRRQKDESIYDSRLRELEFASLSAISVRFPSFSSSALYLLTQLISDDVCRVCNNSVPRVAADLNDRIGRHHCVICNSELAPTNGSTTVLADRQLRRSRSALMALDTELENSASELASAEQEYDRIEGELAQLEIIIAERDRKINGLVDRLPPDEHEIHERRS